LSEPAVASLAIKLLFEVCLHQVIDAVVKIDKVLLIEVFQLGGVFDYHQVFKEVLPLVIQDLIDLFIFENFLLLLSHWNN